MEILVGDVIQLKKPHPCGSYLFTVLRIGMDFKLKCHGCSHIIMLPRADVVKRVKKIIKKDDNR